jgi:hypothetical protein
MAVDVKTDAAFQPGEPRAVFDAHNASWDVTADGKEFLVAMPAVQTAPAPFTVVLNWQAGVRK